MATSADPQWEVDLQIVTAALTALAPFLPGIEADVVALVQLVFGGKTLTADQRAALQSSLQKSLSDALAPLPAPPAGAT